MTEVHLWLRCGNCGELFATDIHKLSDVHKSNLSGESVDG